MLKKTPSDIKKFISTIDKKLIQFTETTVREARITPSCLAHYFFHGLIIMVPLGITLWLSVWFFNLVDGMLGPILEWGLGRPVPGLGFGIIIVTLVLIGYLGVKVGHRKAFDFFEARFIKVPVLGAIYGGTRQVLTSFTTSTNSRFLEVVFMEFPRKGIYTVGLVTSKIENGKGSTFLNIYIPTAPNPTSGFLQIAPEEDVIKTNMSVSDAMKLIISAGKASPQEITDIMSVDPWADKKPVYKT